MTSRTGSSRERRRGGYTLIELLVVITIAGIIMSMGVAGVRTLGRRSELDATTQALRSFLRRARNTAREERFPATVEIDPIAGELRAVTRQTLALFRFERSQASAAPEDAGPGAPSLTRGALNMDAKVFAARPVLGKLGAGLLFGQPVAKQGKALKARDYMQATPGFVEVEDRPSLDPTEGVVIDLWVYPGQLGRKLTRRGGDGYDLPDDPEPPLREAPERRAAYRGPPPLFTMVRKGNAYEVALNANSSVEIALKGPNKAGEEIGFLARSRPGLVPSDKWSHVVFVYDGKSVRLLVNSIERGLGIGKSNNVLPERLKISMQPLRFSDPSPRRSFFGVLDEVRVAGILAASRAAIPRNILALCPVQELVFDAQGRLDPLVHAEPVVIELCDDPNIHEALSEDKEQQGTALKTELRNKPQAAANRQQAFLKRWRKALRRVDAANRRRVIVDLHGLLK